MRGATSVGGVDREGSVGYTSLCTHSLCYSSTRHASCQGGVGVSGDHRVPPRFVFVQPQRQQAASQRCDRSIVSGATLRTLTAPWRATVGICFVTFAGSSYLQQGR